MPVSTSAKKALRRDKRRTAVNNILRAQVRTTIKKLKTEKKPELLSQVYEMVDKAAKKHIVHKNKAARIKSRLTKWVGNLEVAQAKPAAKPASKPAAKKTTSKKTAAKKTAKKS